jgi:flagellar capping protein FliD
MKEFDKISIQEMSKEDMLMIIQALEYTGTKTKIKDFINLKNSIVKELSCLAETTEEEFLEYLSDNSSAESIL